MPWQDVDVGWGRRAPEAAYLFEKMHWREYGHILDQAGVTSRETVSGHRLWQWPGHPTCARTRGYRQWA